MEEKLVGEYQIPEKIVTQYKSDLLDGNHQARRMFYQAIRPYAPADLETGHTWKRNCCEYYARQLFHELTEYKIYHEVDYTSTVRMANVIKLMKDYGYLGDESDV